MYTVDGLDKVEELKDFPLPSGGAPIPLVLADDDGVVIAFLLAPIGEEVAIVEFDGVMAHFFGMPNDEAISGHPLFERGSALARLRSPEFILDSRFGAHEPGPSQPSSEYLQSLPAFHFHLP